MDNWPYDQKTTSASEHNKACFCSLPQQIVIAQLSSHTTGGCKMSREVHNPHFCAYKWIKKPVFVLSG